MIACKPERLFSLLKASYQRGSSKSTDCQDGVWQQHGLDPGGVARWQPGCSGALCPCRVPPARVTPAVCLWQLPFQALDSQPSTWLASCTASPRVGGERAGGSVLTSCHCTAP